LINSGNENYENFYKEYLSITNDPTLKESLTFTYNNVKTRESGKPSQNSIMKTKRRKNVFGKSEGKYVYIDVWATWCGLSSRSTIPAKKWKNNIKVKILNLSAFQLTT
jgi:hypothetical protein